jgi:hypothetical protein
MMSTTNRQSIDPSDPQLFRHASQLIGNMALGRGKFVGKKAAGLSASSETRNTRRRFSRSHPHFPVKPTLHVLLDMIVSLVQTKLSQWLSNLQANSYTEPPCPDIERHTRSGISWCSARSAHPCTPLCRRSHGTGRTAKPGSHCVFQQCSSSREPGP